MDNRLIVFDCVPARAAPETSALVPERIRGEKELLQFIARSRRKMADVLQIRLERQTVTHLRARFNIATTAAMT
ncbi:hypothetical protein V1286_000204 [Bradyrhizobium algeriense]|uniref:Uncharacterized protein n=1 Tax=Bradyrhizobium algeriense TaxID=634784 RepID=A0ABU8B2B4_9BRAD